MPLCGAQGPNTSFTPVFGENVDASKYAAPFDLSPRAGLLNNVGVCLMFVLCSL